MQIARLASMYLIGGAILIFIGKSFVSGFRTGIVYHNGRFTSIPVSRKKRPILYWVTMVIYILIMMAAIINIVHMTFEVLF